MWAVALVFCRAWHRGLWLHYNLISNELCTIEIYHADALQNNYCVIL